MGSLGPGRAPFEFSYSLDYDSCPSKPNSAVHAWASGCFGSAPTNEPVDVTSVHSTADCMAAWGHAHGSFCLYYCTARKRRASTCSPPTCPRPLASVDRMHHCYQPARRPFFLGSFPPPSSQYFTKHQFMSHDDSISSLPSCQ
jgi:hypothetical protein